MSAAPLPISLRQALGTAVARQDANLHFRLAQPRRGAGDAQRAGQCQLASAAQRESVDAGNHRLAAVLDQAEYALTAGSQPARPPQPETEASSLISAPATKAFLSCPGQQHGAHLNILLDFEKDLFQLLHTALVERIQHAWPVEGHDGQWQAVVRSGYFRIPWSMHSKKCCVNHTCCRARLAVGAGGKVREMIKGITIVRPAGTPEAYAHLASFFLCAGL